MNKFNEDLQKEVILGKYLDVIYSNLNLNMERIHDKNLQHQGVDLILDHKGKNFHIDEKAQLDYLNNSLPTFTFELSYFKGNILKEGWLFDERKITEYYFLITGIFLSSKSLGDGIKSLKITAVYRKKLIEFLEKKGLNKEYLKNLDKEVRASELENNIALELLKNNIEGSLFLSKQKDEKPLNLKLYLSWLIDNKVAKEIYP